MSSPRVLAAHLSKADRVISGDLAKQIEEALNEASGDSETWLREIEALKAELSMAKGQRGLWQEKYEEILVEYRALQRNHEKCQDKLRRAGL